MNIVDFHEGGDEILVIVIVDRDEVVAADGRVLRVSRAYPAAHLYGQHELPARGGRR